MSDLLRLKTCIDCGYDLRGSPSAGRCPECGVEYTAEMFDVEIIAARSTRHRVVNLLWIAWTPIAGVVLLSIGIERSSGLPTAVGAFMLMLGGAILWAEITAHRAGGDRETIVFLADNLLCDALDLDESEQPGTWSWNERARVSIESTDRADRWRLKITSPDAPADRGVSPKTKNAEVVLDGVIVASEQEAHALVAELRRRFAAIGDASPSSIG